MLAWQLGKTCMLGRTCTSSGASQLFLSSSGFM